MKNRRILVSVAMLLLSAVLLSSASFAWFSMNTTVEVDGIEFEAYSDSLFLEISATSATAGFTPNDITVENSKKALRPVAYGYIGEFGVDGKVYSIQVEEADGYYTDESINYYEVQIKGDANDTKVDANVLDYICINDKLEITEDISAYYVLGAGGLQFKANTDPNYSGALYAKVGNDYVLQNAPEQKLGLYYVVSNIANGNAQYLETNQYYKAEDNGDYCLVNGIHAGSHLKGYYTVTATEVNNPTSGTYYIMNTDNDFVAFAAHAVEDEGLDGYWYRGYSENIDATDPNADAGNISGVIGGMDAQDSDYVLFDTFYIRMAEGSANATNLRISDVTVKGSDDEYALTKAVRVIFICTSSTGEEVARIFYNNETGKFTKLGTNEESTLIDANLIGNTGEVITVDMYVYYDGTHASVATHDALNLSGHAIKVGFEIDKPAYAN